MPESKEPPPEAPSLPAVTAEEQARAGLLPVRAARAEDLDPAQNLALLEHGGVAEMHSDQAAREARPLVDGDPRTSGRH